MNKITHNEIVNSKKFLEKYDTIIWLTKEKSDNINLQPIYCKKEYVNFNGEIVDLTKSKK